MNQQQNESSNGQKEERSNQRTNQERGNHDLNPTEWEEGDTEREFDLDGDKERNLEVTSKTENPSQDSTLGQENQSRSLPRTEDPNVNAENENRRENSGTMRNQPKSDRITS